MQPVLIKSLEDSFKIENGTPHYLPATTLRDLEEGENLLSAEDETDLRSEIRKLLFSMR